MQAPWANVWILVDCSEFSDFHSLRNNTFNYEPVMQSCKTKACHSAAVAQGQVAESQMPRWPPLLGSPERC